MSTITVEQALQLAITWHQAGQLATAEPLYRQILAVHPGHAEALQRLGLLKMEVNRCEDAVELFSRAIAQVPNEARYHADLGAAYRRMGFPAKADACEERARALASAGPDRRERSPRVSAGGTNEAQQRLYCTSPPPSRSGWGVCMTQLLDELSRRLDVVCFDQSTAPAAPLDGPFFMPLTNHAFNPYSAARGTRNYGYTFFEFELEAAAVANAARYEVVFCGSTWCRERMRDRGILNTKVLVQGVDRSVFHPAERAPRPAGQELRIFSGGKFEFRKGHDIVIAAFRKLLERHPRAVLVGAWHNLWPSLFASMRRTPHLTLPGGEYEDQRDLFREILLLNGIPETNFELQPLLQQAELAEVMRSTDFGVFPNRCEGGTNLVLMEYLSCGRPVVASAATGHADVIKSEYALTLQPHVSAGFWDEPEVAEVAVAMYRLAENASLRAQLGAAGAEAMRKWTWERAAQTVIETIFPVAG